MSFISDWQGFSDNFCLTGKASRPIRPNVINFYGTVSLVVYVPRGMHATAVHRVGCRFCIISEVRFLEGGESSSNESRACLRREKKGGASRLS